VWVANQANQFQICIVPHNRQHNKSEVTLRSLTLRRQDGFSPWLVDDRYQHC